MRTPASGPVSMLTRKELPSPGVLSPLISPPSIWARRRLIVRPRPVPPKRRVIELSACEKGWKMAAICSEFMPRPESITSKPMRGWGAAGGSSRRTTKRTPPSSVNLTALPSKLMRI